MNQPLPLDRLKLIEETILALPADKQWQVADFVDFLAERSAAEAEEWFWGLIGLIDWNRDSTELALQPLTEHLEKLPDEEIFRFHDRMAEKLHQLDTPEHFTAAAGSADTFLYGRCLVVAEGKDYYNVLNDPTAFPQDYDLEDLLSVPEIAFENKHSKAYEHLPNTPYETGWNKAAWGEKAVSFV